MQIATPVWSVGFTHDRDISYVLFSVAAPCLFPTNDVFGIKGKTKFISNVSIKLVHGNKIFVSNFLIL